MARPRVNGSRVLPRKPLSHAKGPEDDHDDDAEENGNGRDLGDDTPAGPQPVDALSEMMAGLQGASTSRITVYRIVKNQPPAYVFETDPTGFSLDDLRDKYNGGEFRLYVMKDGRLWKNMRVVVEPKHIHGGAEPLPPATSATSELLAIMRDGFAQQAAALRESMAARSTGPSFNMADLPAIITAAAAAITALRPPPAPAPAAESASKAIDMFMQGLSLARELREEGSGEGGISGMLRDVLKSPIVAAAVQSSIAPQQPQQPQQPRLPQPQPAPVSHAKPADSQPTPQPEQQVLSYYLGFLVGKAKTGAEPSLYAELVLDNVPDAQLTPMLAMGDGLIDYLIGIHAPVAEHREWFVALLKEINELLEPGDEVVESAGDQHAADAASIVVPGHVAQ